MAQPTSVYVTPSTTVVQVETLQTPYTPVLLEPASYVGQVVTILTKLSTTEILTSSIVVSTTSSSFFPTGVSTLIQQPQGYVTVQSQLPAQWAFLNSYPFRDQYLSAGVYSLVTSTLYTATLSTILDTTSSLTVENLIVSGRFFQSSGLVLDTTVSSLGAVTILSSLTVLGPTFFSVGGSTLGAVTLGSTVSVGLNFVSLSSLTLQSTLAIGTFLSVKGILSTSLLQLEGGLEGPALEVQSSSPGAFLQAGSLRADGMISTLSSVNVGAHLRVRGLVIGGNLSTLSTFVTDSAVEVAGLTTLQGSLTGAGAFGAGGSLRVQGELSLSGSLSANADLTVIDRTQVLGTLSTGSLDAESVAVFGSLTTRVSTAISTQTLTVLGSLGTGSLVSISTTVGQSFSTTRDLSLLSTTQLLGGMTVGGSVSTLSWMSIGRDLGVLGSAVLRGSLHLSSSAIAFESVDVRSTVRGVNTLAQSTLLQQDLSVLGNVEVTDRAILQSITLPRAVLAESFEVSTLRVGDQGIAATSLISSLYASTVATGGVLIPSYTMEMSNALETHLLSTQRLSSQSLQVGPRFAPSTLFQVTTSVGIGTVPQGNSVEIVPIVYTTGPFYVDNLLSTQLLSTGSVEGLFFGDGRFLSNVNFPEHISTLVLSTATLIVEKTFISSAFASSGLVTDVFTAYSTLQVGTFNLFGDAIDYKLPSSNLIAASGQKGNLVLLNNMWCFGDSVGNTPKQVIVNGDPTPLLPSNYAFGVYGTLRANQILSPNYDLEINTYRADILVANTIGRTNQTTYFVSSGVIGLTEGTFFIPSDSKVSLVSTNIIQPSLSSLVFNSTLIVSREVNAVGVNTVPFYTLDVNSDAYIRNNLTVLRSTCATGTLSFFPSTQSLWLAVCSNDGPSNLLASSNEGETWSSFPPFNTLEGRPLLGIATDGGPLRITSSNTLASEALWVAVGAPQGQTYREGSDSWTFIDYAPEFAQSNYAVAYNGQIWVVAGVNSALQSPPPTLQWSYDGVTWSSADGGGFSWDGSSTWFGGRSVAWNGSLWVAVGKGSAAGNSILYSLDGRTWQNAASGGFTEAGYGVTWTGSSWVATGDNGSAQRSFVVSTDGSNWTQVQGYGFDGLSNQSGRAVASDGRRVVAVGTYTSASSNASIQYSDNGGLTWLNAQGTLFTTTGDEGVSIAWNGSYWLAGGVSGVRKSLDGVTWTTPAGSPGQRIQSLAFSSNATPLAVIGASNYVSSYTSTVTTLNVACGLVQFTSGLNSLRYSSDGITWSPSLSGWFTDGARAAAFNGSNLWTAAGKGTMSNFVYSGNGKNWSNGTFLDPIGLLGTGTSVAFGAGSWVGTLDPVGGGGKTIWTSSNGTRWTHVSDAGSNFSVAGYGVAFGNGRFFAVGDDGAAGKTIMYAPNIPPATWTAFNVVNQFTNKGTGIAYGGSLWVACGYDATASLKYSGDGSNWSNAVGSFLNNGSGVAYNGSNLWIAVGIGGGGQSNILYSGNGSNWSNVTSGAFLTSGLGVAYNSQLKRWIAAGQDSAGVGTLKYSSDGLTWLTATGGFDSLGYGVAASVVTVSSILLGVNQLRLYDTPGPFVSARDGTPNLSFTSTSLSLYDTITIDRFKNIGFQTLPVGLVSTFNEPGLAQVSSFVSSQAIQVGGYFLSGTFV